MRDIKFRAWNPDSKSMSPGMTLQTWIIDATRSFPQFAGAEGEISNFWDKLIFREFTGLKDCNGNEIYEGDYLRDNGGDGGDGGDVLHRVIWDDDRAGFRIEYWEGGNEWDASNLEEIDWEPRGEKNQLKGYWVCGNVYENPDFLKGEKGVEGE